MEQPERVQITGDVQVRSDASLHADRRAALEADLSLRRRRYWMGRIILSLCLLVIVIFWFLQPERAIGALASFGLEDPNAINICLTVGLLPAIIPLYIMERGIKKLKLELKTFDDLN